MKRIAYIKDGIYSGEMAIIITYKRGEWCLVELRDGLYYPKLKKFVYIIGYL